MHGSECVIRTLKRGSADYNLWGSMTETDCEALYKAAEESLLLKRVGQAEDVALAFVYLMKQKHSTGQNVIVDGGGLLI